LFEISSLGEYQHPLQVIAIDLPSGQARDVSRAVADAVLATGEELTAGVAAFVARQHEPASVGGAQCSGT
jgi:hypothetical protein